LDLEKNRGATFLHEYIKLEGRSWRNALSSTSSVHFASQNSNGYCLPHLKIAPRFYFLKMTFMPALRGETSQVSQFRKLSQLLVKKPTYVWTYSGACLVMSYIFLITY
jgi:hypothetical protein